MPETILIFDLGLTNCKAVAFTPQGEIVARAAIPYPTYRPQPGWVEQSPADWWQAMIAALDQVRAQSPAALEQTVAISVTAHMHALVCLGANGDALGSALVLGDQRALAEAEAITAAVGLERIYRITGARMDASMPLAKIAWLRQHAPEIHHQTRAFLACKDYLRHWLTGDLLTEPVDACGMSAYDIQRGNWSPELMEQAGIRADQLPQVADPCAIAGALLPAAARELGLKPGIPVMVGAGDDVEVLGNGMLEAGTALEHLGTTGSILSVTDHPVYDPQMALELYPHIMSGKWVLGGSVTAAGSALAWADEVLRVDHSAPYVSHPPDLDQPLIFIPHLSGERCPAWNPAARGAWLGLSAAHTSTDLRQAVWEGVMFSLKQVLEQIEALAGPQAHISISERGDENELIARASLYGRPLAVLHSPEPTALGAMIVAAVGVGMYGSLTEAVEHVTGWQRLIPVDEGLCQSYAALYIRYQNSPAC